MYSKDHVEYSQEIEGRHAFLRWLFTEHIRRAIARVTLYFEIKREREILAKLSDSELRDIGVHRAEADAESRRTFFDVPDDRLCLQADLEKGEKRLGM